MSDYTLLQKLNGAPLAKKAARDFIAEEVKGIAQRQAEADADRKLRNEIDNLERDVAHLQRQREENPRGWRASPDLQTLLGAKIDALADLKKDRAERARATPEPAPLTSAEKATLREGALFVSDDESKRSWKDWLELLRTGAIVRDAPREVTATSVSALNSQLAKNRAAQTRLLTRRRETRNAPDSRENRIAAIKAEVRRHGESGWPDMREITHGRDGGKRIKPAPEVAGFRELCAIVPDQVTAALVARMDAQVSSDGISGAERRRLLTEIDAELLELQRVEEAIVRALHAQGEKVGRLPFRHPEALLGVMVEFKAPARRTQLSEMPVEGPVAHFRVI